MSRKTKPLISVIIPHYKSTHFTLQAIKSILRQKNISQNKIEVIVSVDGPISSADKKKMISLSTNVLLTHNKNQEGPGGNRQTGLSLAKGDYIIFLDSDDQLESTFIKYSLVALKSSQVAATVCLSKSFFEHGFSLIDKIRLIPLMVIRDLSLLTGIILNQGCIYPSAFYLCQLSHMMYKSSILKDFKFNYDYRRGGEDWDLIVHTINKGKIKIVPKRLLKFRYSPKSSTSSSLNRQLKWKSYSLLTSRLPVQNKQGIFYQLFLFYTRLFRGNN